MATLRQHLKTIGRRGGLRSRRLLDSSAARDTVRVREARRAYRRFHARYFRNYPADRRIALAEVPWLVRQLRETGDAQASRIADYLDPTSGARGHSDEVDPVVRQLQTASFRRMSAERKLELADELRELARELQGTRDVAG